MPTTDHLTLADRQAIATSLGDAWRTARTSRGLSQAQLAAAIGGAPKATQPRYSRGENGQQQPALDEAVVWADCLGTTLPGILQLAGIARPILTLEEAVAADPRLSGDERRVLLATIAAMVATERDPLRGGGMLSAEQVAAGLRALGPVERAVILRHHRLEDDERAIAARQTVKRGAKGRRS